MTVNTDMSINAYEPWTGYSNSKCSWTMEPTDHLKSSGCTLVIEDWLQSNRFI